ncbi:GNAT family N-acetyltransferase [Pseudoroseicyclus sp. CXY001]|uniref:GNAT family N-acetyltransferase n=1 Tax=Pseudoroseicyclus sp. CXY001 TaxID=3242492 RepID=UPI00358DBAA9
MAGLQQVEPGAELFRTERLVMRAFHEDDLDALAALYADEEVRRHFPDFTRTREETEREMRWAMRGGEAAHPGYTLWAAVLAETGALIGRGGILPLELEGRFEPELAWLLGKPHWGRGLGREMAAGLRDFGFAAGLRRLVALVDFGNDASAATARSIGMRHEKDVDVEGWCNLFVIER